MNGIGKIGLTRFSLALIRAVCLSATTASFALNPVQGWYIGLIGGGTYAPTVNFNMINPFDNHNDKAHLSYLIGGNGGAQFGYRWGNFRIEAEGLFNENKYQQIQFGDHAVLHDENDGLRYHISGYTYFISGLANGIYEFYQPGNDVNVVPYLGLGIGYASIKNSLSGYHNDILIGTTSETSSAAIGQAIAGLSYFFDDFASIGIDYRYLVTTKSGTFNTSFQAQTFNLSFTYAFES